MKEKIDYTGRVFGKVEIIGKSDIKVQGGHIKWNAKCLICNKEYTIYSYNIKQRIDSFGSHGCKRCKETRTDFFQEHREEIRKLYLSGRTMVSIANELGCGRQTISKIIKTLNIRVGMSRNCPISNDRN